MRRNAHLYLVIILPRPIIPVRSRTGNVHLHRLFFLALQQIVAFAATRCKERQQGSQCQALYPIPMSSAKRGSRAASAKPCIQFQCLVFILFSFLFRYVSSFVQVLTRLENKRPALLHDGERGGTGNFLQAIRVIAVFLRSAWLPSHRNHP